MSIAEPIYYPCLFLPPNRFTGLQSCADCESMAEYVKDEGGLLAAPSTSAVQPSNLFSLLCSILAVDAASRAVCVCVPVSVLQG